MLAREAWALHCMVLLSDLRVRPLPLGCHLDLPLCCVEVRRCQVDLLAALGITCFHRLCPHYLQRWELLCWRDQRPWRRGIQQRLTTTCPSC